MKKKSQEERILSFIKRHGKITTLDAFNEIGCSRLSARIFDLRQMGHDIVSERIEVKNRYGEKCYVVAYRLRRKAA